MVIYYYKQNEQRHFCGHSNKVCSISIANSNNLVATGERGSNPKVLIWDLDSLEIKIVLKAMFCNDIHLVEFINKDKYLVVSQKRHDSPIFVYDLHNQSIILSYYIDNFAENITKVKSLSAGFIFDNNLDLDNIFIINSKFKLYFFYLDHETGQYAKITFDTLKDRKHLCIKQAQISNNQYRLQHIYEL